MSGLHSMAYDVPVKWIRQTTALLPIFHARETLQNRPDLLPLKVIFRDPHNSVRELERVATREQSFRGDLDDTIPRTIRRQWQTLPHCGDLFQIEFRWAVRPAAKLDRLLKKLFRFVQLTFGIILHGRIEGCYPGKYFRAW